MSVISGRLAFYLFITLCVSNATPIAHPLLQRGGGSVVVQCPCRVVAHIAHSVPLLYPRDAVVTVVAVPPWREREADDDGEDDDDGDESDCDGGSGGGAGADVGAASGGDGGLLRLSSLWSHRGLSMSTCFRRRGGTRLSVVLRESSATDSVYRKFEADFQGNGVFQFRIRDPLVRRSQRAILSASFRLPDVIRQTDLQCPVLLPQDPPLNDSVSTPTSTSLSTSTSTFTSISSYSPKYTSPSSQYGSAATFPPDLPHLPPVKRPVLPRTYRKKNAPTRLTETTTRIVGGFESGPNIAKYIVSFHQPVPSSTSSNTTTAATISPSTCTGTLVDPSIVITAGHCNVTTDTLVVVGGTGNAREGVVYTIQNVTYHPFYEVENEEHEDAYGIGSFDVAYVVLNDEIAQTKEADFMKINAHPAIPIVGSVVRIAGYGFLSADDSVSLDRLRQADLIVSDAAFCTDMYAEIDETVNTGRVVCAAEPVDTNCSPCTADSGGPLFQYDEDDHPVLVGVVIRGTGCSTETVPALFARTSANFDVFPSSLQWTNSTTALRVSEDGSTSEAPLPSPFVIPDKPPPLPPLSPIPLTPTASPFPSSSPFDAASSNIGSSPSRVTIILASVSAILVLAAVLALIAALLRR